MDRRDGNDVRHAAIGASGASRTLLRPHPASWLATTVAFALLLGLAVTLQWRDGAWQRDFTDDDASHYVTGLFFRDYVLTLLSQGWVSPLDYVRTYHSHYPLIGVGHWGPLFYLVEGAWMLVFPTSRASILVLSAGVTAATAALLFRLVAADVGRLQAGLAAALLVISPIVTDSTAALMLDMPVALCSLAAASAYVSYLRTGATGPGLAFGLAASAALLIKGNAAALALVPPLAVLLVRRLDFVRRASFWVPAFVVMLVAGPWTWFTYDLVAQGFRHPWGWGYTGIAAPENFRYLLNGLGWPTVLLAGLGLLHVLGSRRPNPAASGMAALMLAYMLFQAVVPAELQERYIAPALAPALFLALHALRQALLWIDLRTAGKLRVAGSGAPLQVAGAFALIAAAASTMMPMAPRPHDGMLEAARFIWSQDLGANRSVLLALDGNTEGNMIAELAMGDPKRPSLFAVRGSRLLGGGGYNNRDYAPRFASLADVSREVDRYGIQLVVHQASPPTLKRRAWDHIPQVAAVAASQPGRWETIYTGGPADRLVTVWRITDHAALPLQRAALLALGAPRTLAGD